MSIKDSCVQPILLIIEMNIYIYMLYNIWSQLQLKNVERLTWELQPTLTFLAKDRVKLGLTEYALSGISWWNYHPFNIPACEIAVFKGKMTEDQCC